MTRSGAPRGDLFVADAIPAGIDAAAIAADAALVGAARGRLRRDGTLHRRATLLTGGTLLLTLAVWIVAAPRALDLPTFGACIAALVLAGSVEFEIGPGCALPTAPVQVVTLFLLPPQFVPVAVLLGLIGSSLVARLRDPHRHEHLIVLAGSAWQVVGPAAVFAIAHVTAPRLSDWPVYGLAIASQFFLDAIASWTHTCCGLGVPIGRLAVALRSTFLCDLCIAPIGLAAALAVPGSAGALLFLLPPTALLALLQADRRRQLDETIALGAAFIDTRDLARRDVLTGLANRLAWEEATGRAQSDNASIGVILADVDRLKFANDTFGHDAGDRLLIAVGRVFARSVAGRADTSAFRIGGDEFAILLPGASQIETDDLVQALRNELDATAAIDGRISVSASTGAAWAPVGRLVGRAIANADRAASLEKINRGVRRQA